MSALPVSAPMRAFSPSLFQSKISLETNQDVAPTHAVGTSSHRVYNFEVREHHNYVADGVRVHNESVLSFLTPEEWAGIDWSTLRDLDDNNELDYVEIVTERNGYKAGTTRYKVENENGEEVLKIIETYTDKHGRLVQVEIVRSGDKVIKQPPVILTGAQFGENVGTLITPFLTTAIMGDDATPFEQIATNTILGTFVENIFEFAGGQIHSQIAMPDDDVDVGGSTVGVVSHTFKDIAGDLVSNAADYTGAQLTGWIMAEVFGGMIGDGIGDELFTRMAGEGINYIVDEAFETFLVDVWGVDETNKIFGGALEDLKGLDDFDFKEVFSIGAIGTQALSIGFRRLLPEIETVEGQLASGLTTLALNTFFSGVLSSINGAISTALNLGNFAAQATFATQALAAINPVVAIVSVIVGRIFDQLFEKNPEAFTNVVFNKDTGLFEVGTSWSDDGGNLETGQRMAESYVEFMNGVITQSQSQSNNFAELGDELRLVFGHYEDLIQNGSSRNFEALDVAMQSRVVDTVQKLEINDGDLKFIDVIDAAKIDADFVDDIVHFGSYSYWKKFLGIKVKKKWVYTEVNPEATLGTTNEELQQLVEDWPAGSQDDIASSVLEALNGIYSDLQLTAVSDAAMVARITDRLSSSSRNKNLLLPSKDAAVDELGDALYLRAMMLRVEQEGFNFSSKDELVQAVADSGISVLTDQELYSQLQYNMQIAQEYEQYLADQVAYDAAIAAAGPNSAYAQGWAVTFLEAERLGLMRDYQASGDEISNRFVASSGDDHITGNENNDTVYGYSGNDTLFGNTGDDSLVGGLGDDSLDGGLGSDRLFGGAGSDMLSGGEGNDHLIAGLGDDTLLGGSGENHYAIDAVGDNQIEDQGTGGSSFHLFGVTKDQVTFSDVDGAKVLTWETQDGREGSASIVGWDNFIAIGYGGTSSFGDVTRDGNGMLVFTGDDTEGDVISVGGLWNGRYSIQGGTGNDTLVSAAAAEGGGWNYMSGQAGNDTYIYYASAGDVRVTANGEGANEGQDVFRFADVNLAEVTFSLVDSGTAADGEFLQAAFTDEGGTEHKIQWANKGEQINSFEFADGSHFAQVEFGSGGRLLLDGSENVDVIYSPNEANSYYLRGYAGNDTLVANTDAPGTQYLAGGTGDDFYRYYSAAGNVRITSWGEPIDGGVDTFRFEDLNLADVTVSLVGPEDSEYLRFTYNDVGGDTHTVDFANKGKQINRLEFADGSSLNSVAITPTGEIEFKGTAKEDIINSGSGDDIIFGGAGSDSIHGGAGNDIIYSGENTGGNFENADDWSPDNTWSFWDRQKWVSGDFDGDGLGDLAAVYGNSGGGLTMRAYLSEGNEFASVDNWSPDNTWGFWDSQEWLSGDFDGDGQDDLLAVYSNNNDELTLRTYVSGTNAFVNAANWSPDNTWAFWDTQKWMTGDFNGDGRDDIVAVYDNNDGGLTMRTYLSEGDGFVNANNWSPDITWAFWDSQEWMSGDFNGDGKEDLAAVYDDNDGGLTMRVYLSEDNGFASVANWTPDKTWGFWETQEWFSGDFDGDGKDDIAAVYDDNAGGLTIRAYLSSGDGFTNVGNWTPDSTWGFWSSQKWLTADFDGDGRSELVTVYDNSDGGVRMRTYLSEVNIEVLNGGSGDDSLFGGSGSDRLIGGAGNDHLTGGSGADIFVFSSGEGSDTISDFEDGIDLIEIRGQANGYAGLVVSSSASGVEIAFGNDTIVVEGVSLSKIDVEDFVFV
ncbi:VCBS repeat-containing protein [Shimia sp. R11_0]|uniref:FG-GAP-like repeat-containing protein n=1 Tax=Shimia sp. R11_0 TaxID=2821096 RepID=UPI001ADB974F|nr:FG-GAP-like repeat-containing protein [Shimia sp. R11_0]MBO9477220.1 VCBS repeat-containing protein [Shimia sp. R11_0]